MPLYEHRYIILFVGSKNFWYFYGILIAYCQTISVQTFQPIIQRGKIEGTFILIKLWNKIPRFIAGSN